MFCEFNVGTQSTQGVNLVNQSNRSLLNLCECNQIFSPDDLAAGGFWDVHESETLSTNKPPGVQQMNSFYVVIQLWRD